MMRDLSYLGLPAAITDAVEMHPVEDIALSILRDRFPGAQVNSMIEFDQSLFKDGFFVLVRRLPSYGPWTGDQRWLDNAGLGVHVFAKDELQPDGTLASGDERGAIISDAIRVALRDAANERRYFPGRGGLVKLRMDEEPTRKTDWATSTGPVQYADLPAGVQRYESRYSLWIRRPIWG